MGNSKVILYALKCDHAAPGPSTLVNGALYCAWCQEDKEITGVAEFEWLAKCHNCTYARWAGLSKRNAAIFLDGHLSRNPAHKGHMEYARNPEAHKTAEKMAAWNGRKAG